MQMVLHMHLRADTPSRHTRETQCLGFGSRVGDEEAREHAALPEGLELVTKQIVLPDQTVGATRGEASPHLIGCAATEEQKRASRGAAAGRACPVALAVRHTAAVSEAAESQDLPRHAGVALICSLFLQRQRHAPPVANDAAAHNHGRVRCRCMRAVYPSFSALIWRSRRCRKPRNGETPVPAPIIIIGTDTWQPMFNHQVQRASSG